MQNPQRDRAVLIVLIGVMMTCSAALADGPAAPDTAAAPPARPAAPRLSQDSAPPPLGLVMQRNGGSLFRAENSVHATEAAEVAPGEASADAKSNAPPGSVEAVSFFAVSPQKPKSYKKHDLITVIAKEDSNYTANGTTSETRTQDLNAQLNAFITLRPSLNQLRSVIAGSSQIPQIQTTNENDFKGTGEVDRTDTFTDRFTAEVVDVRPNGTMVLQAIKEIKTDEEQQRMILTGVCRVEDVTSDNTLLTTQLFDLELDTTHAGAVRDSTKRGFLSRLLDTFSPF